MLLKFTAPMLLRGLNPYILVNKKQAYSLKSGWKKPMPVLVQINGKPTPPWRINMMPVGNGDFYLYLHGDVRKASKTQVGDIVTVHISFDKDYISGSLHSLPEWFASALEKNLQAKEHWNMLPPSRKKEILRYFALLKSEEAKSRNLLRAIAVLSGKPGRFMGRLWENGV